MDIFIEFIDEDGMVEIRLGPIKKNDILVLAHVAESLDFKCLNFIDTQEDTIFTERQARQIIDEIKVLRNNNEINQNTLTLINQIANKVIERNHHYLRFTTEQRKLYNED